MASSSGFCSYTVIAGGRGLAHTLAQDASSIFIFNFAENLKVFGLVFLFVCGLVFSFLHLEYHKQFFSDDILQQCKKQVEDYSFNFYFHMNRKIHRFVSGSVVVAVVHVVVIIIKSLSAIGFFPTSSAPMALMSCPRNRRKQW